MFLKFVAKVERGISPTVREGSAFDAAESNEPSLTVGLVPRSLIQRTSETPPQQAAEKLDSYRAMEPRRQMKFRGRSSLLAFLINDDLPSLCDSASLWPTSPFSSNCWASVCFV